MQGELRFDAARPGEDGISAWRRQRREKLRDLGRATKLPLGHTCRVDLGRGVILEGKLLLAEETLFLGEPEQAKDLELRIGDRTFRSDEILEFVRLD